MVQILKDQKLFLAIYTLFIIMASILWLGIEKGDVIVFFSENRTTALNYFFRVMSFVVEPWFFMLLGIVYIYIDYRNSIIIGLVGTSCLFLSHFLKRIFLMPRPTGYFQKLGLWTDLQMVENYIPETGLTSFPSGHTMAAFALFFLLSILIAKSYFSILMIIMAILSGISRIYLMNHFIEDVIIGSAIGLFIALAVKVVMDKMNLPRYNLLRKSIQS